MFVCRTIRKKGRSEESEIQSEELLLFSKEALSEKPEAGTNSQGVAGEPYGCQSKVSLSIEFPDFLDGISLNFDPETHNP